MKKCIYCNNPISKETKSKEHVIPQWIFKYLDSENQLFELTPINKEKHVYSVRKPTAKSFVHQICNTCNNGWLSKIDNSCTDSLKHMMSGKNHKKHNDLTIKNTDLLKISTLIYKIYLNFYACSPFKEEELNLYTQFYYKQKAPPELVLFISNLCTSEPINIASSNVWSNLILNDNIKVEDVNNNLKTSFKFFIQLGHASFILSNPGKINNSIKKITFDRSFLMPIVDHKRITVPETSTIEIPPHPLPNNISTRILFSIKFRYN